LLLARGRRAGVTAVAVVVATGAERRHAYGERERREEGGERRERELGA